MLHKTVHNVWNLFKHSKQLPENLVLRVLMDQEELRVDWSLFLIDRIGIELVIELGRSTKIIFLISSKSFDWSNIINFEFSLKKFHNLNFLLYQLYETIFSKLKHHYYNLSIYIPTYTTYPCNNNIFLAWLVFYHA